MVEIGKTVIEGERVTERERTGDEARGCVVAAEYEPVFGRDVAALFNPRPVMLVTAGDAEATSNACTVAWSTPVSYSPPLIAVCLKPTSLTYELITRNREFVVNILDGAMRDEVEVYGGASGHQVDKAGMLREATCPADRLRPPRFKKALAWLECTVDAEIPAGDHVLVIGRVLVAQSRCRRDRLDRIVCEESLLCLQRDRFGIYTDLGECSE